MRNYFSVVRSIGLILFGVGVLTVGVTLPDFMDRLYSNYNSSIWKDGLAVYLLTGVGYLIVGISGLLKAKWFPRSGLFLLAFSFLLFSWTWYTLLFPNLRGEDFFIGLGVLGMGYSFLIILSLLLRNENFLAALIRDDAKRDEDDRILDA